MQGTDRGEADLRLFDVQGEEMIALALVTVLVSSNPPAGVVDPACTLEKICQPGYTATVRPPASYTSKLKRRQIAERALPGKLRDYEEDHWVPLELCGDPGFNKVMVGESNGWVLTHPENLWPEPWSEARQKDRVENYLHREVCAGMISLEDAQEDIRYWWNFYEAATEKRP